MCLRNKNKMIYNIIKNTECSLYQAIRNNILAKMTTELVLIFHRNITKLVFLWPKMLQSVKLLAKEIDSFRKYEIKNIFTP